MSDEPRIWLLRHAESRWNAEGRWQGHGDPPLSPSGRRAAAARAVEVVARVSRSGRPVRLFSSDLQRAVETAAFVAARLGQQPTRLRALREIDVGSWSGLTRAEIAIRDPEGLRAFDAEDPEARAGGGESRREARARVLRAVGSLALRHPETDLLLVVHRGVIRALVPEAAPVNLELLETRLAALRRE